MLTDPVSSPTSPFGKALIGVIAGLMTVLIRIQGQLPEGVVFAIAIANVLSPLIDRMTTSMTNKNMTQKWVTIASVLIVSLAINGSIAFVRVKGANPASSSESSTSEEPIIPFKVLSGSYGSAACDEAEYCPVQTQTVNVNLDKAFDIISIELSGTNTTETGSYRNKWTAGEADVVAYYESLSIAEIQALDPMALPEDAFVADVTETSKRLINAIQDALADVEVYIGSATSNAEPEHYADQTTTVTIYVIDGVIESIAPSGTITTGGGFQRDWDAAYETIFEYYVGMTVADFLALGAFPVASDAFLADLTYSSERLYDAMVDALSGYGG
jgi:phage-related tail fiber protein